MTTTKDKYPVRTTHDAHMEYRAAVHTIAEVIRGHWRYKKDPLEIVENIALTAIERCADFEQKK